MPKTKVLTALHLEFLLLHVSPQGGGWWLLFLHGGIPQSCDRVKNTLPSIYWAVVGRLLYAGRLARPGTVQVSTTQEPLASLEISF